MASLEPVIRGELREQMEIGVSCPHDYPFFHDDRCWPTHRFDNIGVYGPNVEPIVADAIKDLPWQVAGGRWWKVDDAVRWIDVPTPDRP